MNNNQVTNNNDIEVLKLVERFGFKFFGYDESSQSLVVAPNGQIVLLGVAYEFVKKQIEVSQGGGFESMPQMPQLPAVPDSNLEKSLESENKIGEKSKEAQGTQSKQQTTVSVNPAVVAAPVRELESPYGDGFQPPINPAYIERAIEYIKRNSSKSLSSTSKWLSIQFEKFIGEQNLDKSAK